MDIERRHNSGITLFELVVIIVAVGLIIGVVFVSQSLVTAASVRAQIAQMEKLDSMVGTFRGKYNNQLPGDMNASTAQQFGFTPRSSLKGQGDGDGVIEGSTGNCGYQSGEALMFWVDMSTAKMTDIAYNTAKPDSQGAISRTQLNLYLPPAKIGRGNYLYVFNPCSGPVGGSDGDTPNVSGIANYFGISAAQFVDASSIMSSNVGLTVQEAYNIDNKVDDGLPLSGRVRTMYLMGYLLSDTLIWASGGNAAGAYSAATPASSTTCYDNGGTAGGTMQYSVGYSSGHGVNCALSVQFQ